MCFANHHPESRPCYRQPVGPCPAPRGMVLVVVLVVIAMLTLAGFTFTEWMMTERQAVQIYGRKQYFVYAPDQTPFMYPVPDDPNRSQLNDVESPDLGKFPLFAQARGLTFTLDVGEMLFVPGGWWHTVRMLTPSITLSVNSANSSNWRMLSRDLCRQVYRIHPSRKKRLKLAAYLGAQRALNTLKDWAGSPS